MIGGGGSRKKVLIAVLWPSFVFAGIFTALLFAFVDPFVVFYEFCLKNVFWLLC
jgi:hypothetical protein